VFFLVMVSRPVPEGSPTRKLLLLGGMLMVGGVLWLAYWIIDQTIGRLVPPLRRCGGAVLLLLAMAPWLMTAILLATP
jgi:hypothetical protein